MLSGNLPALKPVPNGASATAQTEQPFDAEIFARFLLGLPQVREVKAALNAILLDVTCTARNPFDNEMEETGDELDSGTWFFIRMSDLPGPEAVGGLVSFVREAQTNSQP